MPFLRRPPTLNIRQPQAEVDQHQGCSIKHGAAETKFGLFSGDRIRLVSVAFWPFRQTSQWLRIKTHMLRKPRAFSITIGPLRPNLARTQTASFTDVPSTLSVVCTPWGHALLARTPCIPWIPSRPVQRPTPQKVSVEQRSSMPSPALPTLPGQFPEQLSNLYI